MNKRHLQLIFSIFLLLFSGLTVTISDQPVTEESTISNSRPFFSNTDSISIDQISISDPLIDELVTDITNPGSNDDVMVSAPIYDAEGIDNATLFWTYDTFNDTLYNTSMVSNPGVSILSEINYQMQRTGYYTSFGQEVEVPTNYRFAEHVLEGQMSYLAIDFEPTGGNGVVYYRIETKNITTNAWDLEVEFGGVCCTTTPLLLPTWTGNNYAGFRVFVVAYDSVINDVSNPRFNFLQIEQDHYEGVIPASIDPTFVTYYVSTYDTTGNMSTSPSYNFLMNDAPTVAFNNLASVVGGDELLLINVTVTENDNITTLNPSSVIAYYKLQSSEIWSSITLVHFNTTSNYTAIYTQNITIQQFGTEDPNLEIMVNATDIVGGLPGYNGSILDTVIIDNILPTLVSILFDTRTPVVNSSHPEVETYIEATFSDDSGIQSANLWYSIPSSSDYISISMQNMSNTLPNVTPITFNATFPAINETGFVDYYFEVTDFLNNTGKTRLNSFYLDGEGPVIDNILIYPSLITNTTDVSILYDVEDISGLQDASLYYSYDGGVSWDKSTPNTITYNEIPIENFDFDDFIPLPLYINNSELSYAKLTVNQTTNELFQKAFLSFVIVHDLSTDVRVWINVGGQDYLVFDREYVVGAIVVEVDLLELGIDKSYFVDSNFTLIIEDFSELYVGTLEWFQIDLVDYDLPFGFTYEAIIPAPNNDTQVMFYIQSIDLFYNIVNSTMFQYYVDGLAPVIIFSPLASPLDAEGAYTVRVSVDVSDMGGIQSVEFYYRFDDEDAWLIQLMEHDVSNTYFADIPLLSENGNLSYFIKAIDIVGLNNRTIEYFALFSNAQGPLIVVDETYFNETRDLEDLNYYRIIAVITDDGQVVNVTISYKFELEDEFEVADMLFNETLGIYYFDILVIDKEGIIIFQIIASDDSGIQNKSDLYTISYENATQNLTGLENGLVIGGAVVVVGGGVAAAVIIIKKKGKFKV